MIRLRPFRYDVRASLLFLAPILVPLAALPEIALVEADLHLDNLQFER